jgi:hypothetical protein
MLRADVAFVAARVTQLSGIQVSLGPDATSTEPAIRDDAANEIVVTVGRFCSMSNEAGCAVVWSDPTSGLIVDTRISVAPDVANDPVVRRAVLLHEFGHALGLEHFTSWFQSFPQAMDATVDRSLSDFRSGDAAGLSTVAATSRSYLPSRNPLGALEFARDASSPGMPRIRVVGWSGDHDALTNAVPVLVFVDGVLTSTLWPYQARGDVAAAYSDLGSNHGFDERIPVSVGTHRVCARAVNQRFGTGDTELGCAWVVVADPGGAPTTAASSTPPPLPGVALPPPVVSTHLVSVR